MEENRSLQYAKVFQKMIQCETVSVNGKVDVEKFRKFHLLLKQLFPDLFSVLQVEEYNGSLLMKWEGKSSEHPILLMSHHDVVDVSGDWKYPPFSGEIADGKIWGRGTLDTKNTLWAMLQAADELVKEGYIPSCDIWFESACTEETDGMGADTISQVLLERGIRFSMVLDEGGYILHDPLGGADYSFAVVGVGEKGCADLKFTADGSGGHASMPGKNSPLVRLGKFMNEVDSSSVFPAKMNEVTTELLYRYSFYMKGILGFLFRHVEFFRPLLTRVMPMVSDAAGAMLKTTLAFTMAEGSTGRNVMPQEAWVVGNMRFSHHQGQKSSIEAVSAIAKKYDIRVEILDPGFTSEISDFRSEEFRYLEKTVKNIFKDTAVVPYVMTGASDCRFFGRVCDNCFRFAPFAISDEQLSSIHGVNENLDIAELPKAVDFYRYIIQGGLK